jgi:aminopeptidase N
MSLARRSHAFCACHAGGSAAPKPFALPGTARVYERPRPFAIQHLALDLELDPDARSVSGTATLDFERVDPDATELPLDAVGFEISRVELGEAGALRPAGFTYDGDVLRVAIPAGVSRAKVAVRYRATPRRGLYFLAPDEHVQGRPKQVWSQCQDEDARHWFPCHDKPHAKFGFELSVRVPNGWQALSNGDLVRAERDASAPKWRWSYRMPEPLPSYLVTLVAGEFAVVEDAPEGEVPLAYWVPKGREADAQRTFGRTREMIRRFGELTGVPYPWSRYTQVVVSDFVFGGMENTTATTLYEHTLLDPRAALDITSDDLVAHELAHQWFGDFVTCRDWSHGWLNEGFATYLEHVDLEAHKGRDEYDWSIQGDLDAYLAEAGGRYRRPIVSQDYEEPIDLFDRHLYQKGGLVLHMLRAQLGDALFWKGVRTYLARHGRGIVETRDLERAFEEVSGRSLQRFFEQWVHRPGHPEIEVKLEHDAGLLVATVRQKQKTDAKGEEPRTPLFAFDLVLDVVDVDGNVRRETRRIERAEHTVVVPCAARPRFVVVDPEHAVIGDVEVQAPADWLRQQLAAGSTARARWLAAKPLGRRADRSAIDALAVVLADEKAFWGLRAACASALGETRRPEAEAALIAALGAAHPKVRRAVAQALGRFRTSAAADAVRKLALRDPSYLVEAEAARALGSTRQASAFDVLVEVLDRPSWADVIRAGALDGMAALRDERALPHVLARTRYGVPTRGRRAAILALPKLDGGRKTREALEELLDDADPHLRIDVVRALVELADPKARPALTRRLGHEDDGRVKRRIREALRDLAGTARQEHERLQSDLDKLRGEHATLLSRVEKLEASLGERREKPPRRAAPAVRRRRR